MTLFLARFRQAATQSSVAGWSRLFYGLIGNLAIAIISGLAYLAHASLATAVSLHFTLVVLAALRQGIYLSTSMALTAVVCIDFFFISPVFTLQVQDTHNWITLAVFEGAALLVSSLSAKMRRDAEAGELQRKRTGKLYELSRAILLIDGRRSTSEQLRALIRELMHVRDVDIWVAYENQATAAERGSPPAASALATYVSDKNSDEPEQHTSRRVLRIGTAPIGALVLQGWETDPLLADAVSSLAAVALERARAIEKENRAEVARSAEQLRTAVLDGLAHGFKTPLTAIQTASSGLLAIGQLSEIQEELVSIIDEQATLLAQLTTRLLQTAALESKDVRLHRASYSILSILDSVLREQDALMRGRVSVVANPDLASVLVDRQLVGSALLQLMDNAIKYSTVGSMVRVSISQSPDETRVMVENEGATIPAEKRGLIFERYYRGVDAIQGPSGTGLGLSIVKKTAEAHGGSTWVESEANCTRFFFTIAGGKRVDG